MQQLYIAIDVDGTLIDWNEQPNQPIVELIKFFKTYTKNVRVIVWSRRGKYWADEWVDKLDLRKYVWRTTDKDDPSKMHIAFDDQHSFSLAEYNVIVRLK